MRVKRRSHKFIPHKKSGFTVIEMEAVSPPSPNPDIVKTSQDIALTPLKTSLNPATPSRCNYLSFNNRGVSFNINWNSPTLKDYMEVDGISRFVLWQANHCHAGIPGSPVQCGFSPVRVLLLGVSSIGNHVAHTFNITKLTSIQQLRFIRHHTGRPNLVVVFRHLIAIEAQSKVVYTD